MTPKQPSLRAQALAWLAQREHSRSELRRKLLQRQRRRAAADASAGDDRAASGDTQDAIELLLDALQAQQLLSDERFVASRLQVRTAGSGTRRIENELARHGLKLAPQTLHDLRAGEMQRALALWQRRFGSDAARDARELARRMRFLAARGFSADVVRRVAAGMSAATPPEDLA